MILLTKDFGHYVHFTGIFIEILNNHSLNVVFSIGEKLKKTSFTVLGIIWIIKLIVVVTSKDYFLVSFDRAVEQSLVDRRNERSVVPHFSSESSESNAES